MDQTLPELWQLRAMPAVPGSLLHAHCPLVKNLFPDIQHVSHVPSRAAPLYACTYPD